MSTALEAACRRRMNVISNDEEAANADIRERGLPRIVRGRQSPSTLHLEKKEANAQSMFNASLGIAPFGILFTTIGAISMRRVRNVLHSQLVLQARLAIPHYERERLEK